MLEIDELTDAELTQFIELFHESLSIKTHFELFLWLQGRLQKHLPHDILIAAWGDFSIGVVYFDVISALPGVRTENINNDNDNLVRFLKRLFNYWESNGCAPLQLSMDECRNFKGDTGCEVIAQNFNNMKSLLVHAIKDFRGRHDCLYVLLSSEKTHSKRVCKMFEALLPYIDTSLRKVPHLPEQVPALTVHPRQLDLDIHPDITPREAEIMTLVRVGKTNNEIGSILDISAFTVKNHLQRIFKKLNVSCRAQAVAKF
jgi:transcriptional regulator EpsA